jgi:hypothetical protein
MLLPMVSTGSAKASFLSLRWSIQRQS